MCLCSQGKLYTEQLNLLPHGLREVEVASTQTSSGIDSLHCLPDSGLPSRGRCAADDDRPSATTSPPGAPVTAQCIVGC